MGNTRVRRWTFRHTALAPEAKHASLHGAWENKNVAAVSYGIGLKGQALVPGSLPYKSLTFD